MSSPPIAASPIATATRAVYIAFILNGFGFGSWSARIPQIRDALGASPAQLGWILFSVAVGSITALPLAGAMVARFGAKNSVRAMCVVVAIGLVVVGSGYRYGVVPTVAGLFLIGFGTGSWDVSMNVEGAAVEQRAGQALMPRFHAGFSVGTVVGALVGAAMVATGTSVTTHLAATAATLVVIVPYAVRPFGTSNPPVTGDAAESDRTSAWRAWTEPRTVAIGLFVLAFAFAEGTGTDWLAIVVIDGYQSPPVAGPLTYAAFLAAMTAGRWFGPAALDRYGRVPTLLVSSLLAVVGLLLVIFSPVLGLAVAGALLWGVGIALGFPVGISAAADDPSRAAARVSVASSIGYTAFLAGPPLLGLIGDQVGVQRSLLVAVVVVSLVTPLVGAVRLRPMAEAGTLR